MGPKALPLTDTGTKQLYSLKQRKINKNEQKLKLVSYWRKHNVNRSGHEQE